VEEFINRKRVQQIEEKSMSAAVKFSFKQLIESDSSFGEGDTYQAKNERFRDTLQCRLDFLNYLNKNGNYFATPFRIDELGIDLNNNEAITKWTLNNNKLIDTIREIEEVKRDKKFFRV
jgi:hypothetical protein